MLGIFIVSVYHLNKTLQIWGHLLIEKDTCDDINEMYALHHDIYAEKMQEEEN